jgi:hypothetical protein
MIGFRSRQRPFSQQLWRCHPSRGFLILVALLMFLWHLYNLQKLDRWVTQLLQEQHTQKLQERAMYFPEHAQLEQHSLLVYPSSKPDPFFSRSENLNALISLGPHFLTTISGCRMARWVYPTATLKNRYRDCQDVPRAKILLPSSLNNTLDYLQPFDTIYVTFQKLPNFVETILPLLKTDVVILSGQIYKMPPLEDSVIQSLLEHPQVVHWFVQNLNVHVDLDKVHDPTKISPFPYGLKETTHKHHSKDEEALQTYRDIFFKSLIQQKSKRSKKNPSIYIGPLHPWPERVAKKIPGASHWKQYLTPSEYYTQLSQHEFVLSPNGDRPECYRHYEALGLGVVPITELDHRYYSHLQDGPVVFDVADWNITHLQETLQLVPRPALRNVILEEYWMEYVEQQVGHPLQWWDSSVNCSTTLSEMQRKAHQVVVTPKD